MNRPSLRSIVALSGICAIAASLFISHLFAQTYGSGTYSGSGSSGSSSGSGYTSYIQSGPAANMQRSGYLNFQVPLARAGHSFSLKYRNNGGTFLTGAANVVGIATGPGASGAATPLYLAVAAPLPNYPNLPAEWYLLDTTNVPQEARHQTLGLVNAQWHSTGVSDTYFAIPSARLGHALIVGSTAAGWIQLNQGQVLGAYVINGSTVTYQPGTWLEAWGPASAPFYVADLTSGQKYTDQNATEALVAERWVQDSSIYPVKDVTFFLDAAELPCLHAALETDDCHPGGVAATRSGKSHGPNQQSGAGQWLDGYHPSELCDGPWNRGQRIRILADPRFRWGEHSPRHDDGGSL